MKLFLVVILCLQLLQQEDAAPSDGIEREEKWKDMQEEALENAEPGAEAGMATNDWNNPDLNEKNELGMAQEDFSLDSDIDQSLHETGDDIGINNEETTESYDAQKSKQEKVSASQTKCVRHLSDVNTKQYSSDVMIGGVGASLRNINQNGESQGHLVRSLKFWRHNGVLGRLETELSDGTKHSCGYRKEVASETFHFAPDEKITSLTLHTENSNCNGAITGVSFWTNKHRNFRFRGHKSKHYYYPRVGSGILVGFKGRCGALVDALMFLFLQKVESSTLSNVHYPNINSLSVIERPVHINGMRFNNKGSKTEQEFTFSGTRPVHETHQWSFGSTGLETKLNTHVEASTVSVNMPTGTSLISSPVTSNPYTHGREMSFNNRQSYNFNIKVPPGKQVIATATAYQGIIKTPYTGTLTVKLTTGRKFSYSVTGVYRSRTTSNVVVTTKDTA